MEGSNKEILSMVEKNIYIYGLNKQCIQQVKNILNVMYVCTQINNTYILIDDVKIKLKNGIKKFDEDQTTTKKFIVVTNSKSENIILIQNIINKIDKFYVIDLDNLTNQLKNVKSKNFTFKFLDKSFSYLVKSEDNIDLDIRNKFLNYDCTLYHSNLIDGLNCCERYLLMNHEKLGNKISYNHICEILKSSSELLLLKLNNTKIENYVKDFIYKYSNPNNINYNFLDNEFGNEILTYNKEYNIDKAKLKKIINNCIFPKHVYAPIISQIPIYFYKIPSFANNLNDDSQDNINLTENKVTVDDNKDIIKRNINLTLEECFNSFSKQSILFRSNKTYECFSVTKVPNYEEKIKILHDEKNTEPTEISILDIEKYYALFKEFKTYIKENNIEKLKCFGVNMEYYDDCDITKFKSKI